LQTPPAAGKPTSAREPSADVNSWVNPVVGQFDSPPAMAAGSTNRVWTHRDIAALLD
jgi:hypothetical protein